MSRRDPLANPRPLIERVYAYAAYRLGPGPDAEDITSEVFERALRYRSSFDPSLGTPQSWLIGIARRCVDDLLRNRPVVVEPVAADGATGDFATTVDRSLDLGRAIAQLDQRSQDLLALRYGADLTAQQIGEVLGLKPNAVDVALHRTISRLRSEIGHETGPPAGSLRAAASADQPEG